MSSADTTLYFTIRKQELFDLIQKSFPSAYDLYESVKKDFPRMQVRLNGTVQHQLCDFVQWIKKNEVAYLVPVLLLCNQNAHYYYYEKLYTVLAKYNYHLVSSTQTVPFSLCTNITLLPIMKQVCVQNQYDVIELETPSENCVIKKKIHVEMIVDLCSSEDVMIRIRLF
jgi:hypothetical protein